MICNPSIEAECYPIAQKLENTAFSCLKTGIVYLDPVEMTIFMIFHSIFLKKLPVVSKEL